MVSLYESSPERWYDVLYNEGFWTEQNINTKYIKYK